MRLSRARARSAGILTVLILAVTGGNMVYTAHEVRVNAQQRCSSLLADASIKMPPAQPGDNARTWEASFEAIAAARWRQLGCAP